MALKIYPQGWIEPPADDPVVLNPTQRALVKTKMKDYVTAQGKPVLIKEIIEEGQRRIANNYPNVHVNDDDLKEIALEIREEWGYPGQEE
ncbi:MAG: hypothetical protein ACYTFK_14005 [Planctomycetota bacterium]|jgi:hypothetical protein